MPDRTEPSSRAPAVATRAAGILERVGILKNPYLAALSDGTMSRDAFRVTQEQFFFAVTFFPRPMAALVGRIEDPGTRLDILHNLVEEHGEFDPRAFHHNTFQEFLARLGSDVAALGGTAVWPELRAFNSVLIAACVLDEMEVGVGCMGIIEHAFAAVSAAIGQAVVGRGWLTGDRLVHYRLHAEIDIRHSEEFYAVVEPRWADEARRYYILQGLELGAYVFNRLYTDLYERGRRIS